MAQLNTPLVNLFGVGPKRGEALRKLGLETVGDFLFHFPRKYLDRRKFKKISETFPGETVSLCGEIIAAESRRIRRLTIVKFAFSDKSGIVYLVFFNQPYMKDILEVGKKLFVYGTVEEFNHMLQMRNPLCEPVEPHRKFDYILPVYSLTAGISQNFIRNTLRTVLRSLNEPPEDLLPFEDRQRLGLSSMRHALTRIHFPSNEADLDRARRHLIFDEFFKLQIGLLRQKELAHKPAQSIFQDEEFPHSIIPEFEKLLPFALTLHQKKVLGEIVSDLQSRKMINRLVQGEVGSGKTVIAIFLLYLMALKNRQGVFLAPTEILAEQHYLNWHPFFLAQDIESVLLVGSLTRKMKNIVLESIESGSARVIFGTQALLNEAIDYPALGAVVVDEQHKFGVEQRNFLKKTRPQVHYLAMSATPIPRSIALTLFGNTDISTVGQLPHGLRHTVSLMFKDKEKEKIYALIRENLAMGNQGYYVAPAIEETSGFASVKREFELLKTEMSGYQLGLLHGKLSANEKSALIAAFRKKEILLLVSTSVIEVGMDIPEAHFIVIDQAEKFGLSQLHQMRGRVGRSGRAGLCILISHSEDPEVVGRLESFLAVEDGWKLAEIDLSIRGPGDLLGVRQHGVMPLKLGDIVKDVEILEKAREEAERIIGEKLYLYEKYRAVKEYLDRLEKNAKLVD